MPTAPKSNRTPPLMLRRSEGVDLELWRAAHDPLISEHAAGRAFSVVERRACTARLRTGRLAFRRAEKWP
jgi:hypothetical protein